ELQNLGSEVIDRALYSFDLFNNPFSLTKSS
ncbi:MAG: hypothetical protein ACI9J5_001403, partial [Paraglaciecola sp.]